MKKPLLGILALSLSLLFISATSVAADLKEWTVIVFLNGHNSLDSYGKENIDSMSTVGSTDKVNVVVQWASEAGGSTKRILVNKGGYDLIQDMNIQVDMGDVNNFVDFVKWSVQKYPAKKYLIDVWNHGNGWHMESIGAGMHPMDISYDDISGHVITTEQLGQAMTQISQFTGGKIELYASDACMMAMGEVAAEMATSVKFFGGSEETEPGAGWPYSTFLADLTAHPEWDGGQTAKALSKDYKDAYNGGVYGNQEVTFSAWDLSKLPLLFQSVANLGKELSAQDSAALAKTYSALSATQSFALPDYRDLGDFLDNVGSANLRLSSQALGDVRAALSQLVLESDVTTAYAKAHGISIWLPSNAGDLSSYADRYSKMVFNQQTNWLDFLNVVMKTAPASISSN